jgi:Skp family chaperone for outer membrane proteins
VYEVIKEYSEKMNYDLVLTQPVLYASPVVDITDEVLAELNAAK